MPDIEQIRTALDGNAAQAQLLSKEEERAYAEHKAVLSPTPEAIYRQVEKTQDRIDGANRYAGYAAEMIARGPGGREVALAITKLQEAESWIWRAQEILKRALPEA